MNWRDELDNELNIFKGGKVLIAGTGNPFRRDDAIGVVITKRLTEQFGKTQQNFQDISVHTVGLTPEDCIDIAVAEKPEIVIMIDACDAGLEPGEIVIFHETDLPDGFHTSHSISPKFIARMIHQLVGSKVIYLGIQIAEAGFGEEVSEAVGAAGAEVVRYFMEKPIFA